MPRYHEVSGVGVPHIGAHELDALVDDGVAAVHVGAERVEDAYLVSGGEGRVDDGAADEPRAAGDQQPHEPSTEATAAGSISSRPA